MMSRVVLCLFVIVEFTVRVLGSSGFTDPPHSTCNASAVFNCEMGKAGVHYEKSIDACNLYEYWGNCLKSHERDCRGDSYYEERVYSHRFDGAYYCPWLFSDDQPAPSCDKRALYQCRLRNNYGHSSKTNKCPFLIEQRDCLESFRNSCSEYNKYSELMHNWKYTVHLDCPELQGCNRTLYQSCWDKVDFTKVDFYDPSSFHLLCGDNLDDTLPCIIDQTERCKYQEEALLSKHQWNFQMLVYSCYGTSECNLVKLNECALENYSENVWLMTVPAPAQTRAICRKSQAYMKCVAPFRKDCLQHKSQLQSVGHVSLSAVVDRMETLYRYLSLICIEKHDDIMNFGAGCYDTQTTGFGLFVCESDQTPMNQYAQDQQRCLSLQNQTTCIRNALSENEACVEESIETAQHVAAAWEQFLLSLHHGFTCDGSEPVRITTRKPTTDRGSTREVLADVSGSNDILGAHWIMCFTASITLRHFVLHF
ncbi:uncharacterized protein LOC125659767 [Ostrea edulis]|uniref:uncharacterized protein LOC125659767 n=1 Tax=Ostrea edulis TaxID=37623 RepID=UPI0020943647|nr:uncharacterized protein LOC125659767 [Ostrea edulis]